jgi:hypothetical protein
LRLACVNSEDAKAGPAAVALAAGGELDLLQSDYSGEVGAEYCASFLEQLRTLHKHFFLDPNLRLITNAGAGGVVPCVEALGSYLREHGDAAMPITAVRGDNLLPRLGELTAAGVELNDEITGQPLLSRDERLLAAQVELGAGPLATAWEEGSRMIVAGHYDPTAPFLGAAKSALQLAWEDYDALASVAIAAQAAQLAPAIVELYAANDITLQAAAEQLPAADVLVRQLQEQAASDALITQADLVSDLSALALEPTEFGGLRVTGGRGQKPTGTWRVRLTYSADGMVDSPQIVQRWARVPRDAVYVSVDTRPAAEWL